MSTSPETNTPPDAVDNSYGTTPPRNDWPDIKLPEGASLSVLTNTRNEEVAIRLTLANGDFAVVVDSQESYKRYDEAERRETVSALRQIAVTEGRLRRLAELPFKTFYVTTAANHPGGAGYWEVTARDREEAREVAFRNLGPKWAFDYENLEDIHPLDRARCHGGLE